MATKLEKLLQKEEQLKAQIQQAKAAERTLEKKRDTRRKILVGAAVMARVESGRWPKDDLLEMMDGFLTRPNERELFELDELEGSVDAAGGERKVSATDKKPFGKHSTAQKKATNEKLRVQREKDAAAGDANSSGALPVSDLDIEKEFSL